MIWKWTMIPILKVCNSTSPADHHKIEENMIVSVHPTLNWKSKAYRSIASSLVARLDEGKGLPDTTRRKLKKRRSGVQDRSLNGKITKFYDVRNPAKVFYDLKKLILCCVKSEPKGSFSIMCKYGSSLTDITSYQYLSYKFGKVSILCDGAQMPIRSVIKNYMYKGANVLLTIESKNFLLQPSLKWDQEDLTVQWMKDKPIQFGLNLWKKRKGIEDKLLRAKTSQFLKRYFFYFYGFIIQDNYRIAFPN